MDLAASLQGLSIDGDTRQAYYAVSKGRVPGVYLTHQACRQQTDGFHGAVFRKFMDPHEAFAWFKQKSSNPPPQVDQLLQPKSVPVGAIPSKGYYAVRKGHIPGIYCTHEQFLKQVSGFSRPEHLKCKTLQQAREFLQAKPQQSTPIQTHREPEPQEYWAIRKGKNPGIYVTSELAILQKKGISRPQARKFATMKEAVSYLHGDSFPTNKFHAVRGPRNRKRVFFTAKEAMQMMADCPTADYEVFDSMVDAYLWFRRKTCSYWVETEKSVHNIYVDGCCLGNGRSNATAGYGVYWPGKGDWCGPIKGKTNNAAELSAILVALQKITEEAAGDTFNVYSDSEYAINCVTKWGDAWDRNGWVTAKGGRVENSRLIRRARTKLRELQARRYDNFQLLKVAGHSGVLGNEIADSLANRGANGEIM